MMVSDAIGIQCVAVCILRENFKRKRRKEYNKKKKSSEQNEWRQIQQRIGSTLNLTRYSRTKREISLHVTMNYSLPPIFIDAELWYVLQPSLFLT